MDWAPDYAVTPYHNVGVKRPMPLDLEDLFIDSGECLAFLIVLLNS